uniref:RxLR effector protein n=1 Tax=Phytophthora agathidicida TaxID=1642459 RepID=A0A7G4WI35_9STRA|nr:PaRXLR46 [Phytophthora agathidicida]
MRLSQVLAVLAASFLISSDVLATADPKQAKISAVAATSSFSHRFLRTSYKPEEDKDDFDDSEVVEERAPNVSRLSSMKIS